MALQVTVTLLSPALVGTDQGQTFQNKLNQILRITFFTLTPTCLLDLGNSLLRCY